VEISRAVALLRVGHTSTCRPKHCNSNDKSGLRLNRVQLTSIAGHG
jgi:hypothetical protein